MGPFEGCVPLWRFVVGCSGLVSGFAVVMFGRFKYSVLLGGALVALGTFIWLTGHYVC